MRKKILFLIIFLAIFGIVSKVSALETTWPPSPFGTNLTDDSNLTDLVRYIYEWGIFIGGLAVFISLLIGGFLYLTSAGDPGRMAEAKDRIYSALIGLVLLFSIYLILNTINPELTILSMPTFAPPGEIFEGLEGTGLGGEPCEKVMLYDQENCGGNVREIDGTHDCESVATFFGIPLGSITVNSVRIEGGCTVRLYDAVDCPYQNLVMAFGNVYEEEGKCDVPEVEKRTEGMVDFSSFRVEETFSF